jgi:predicted porin
VPRIGATIPQQVPKRFCEFGLTSTKEILMNKKLIALAVAGVCAAPTVMAQSANPITLYGAMRMDLEYVEAGGLSGTPDVNGRVRLVEHPNLLGVRGSEDLGGGLKAWFQLETGFDAQSTSGAFANRNSGVGLQGGWGSFLIGRWDMPMKQDVGKTDLWGDINRADYTAATMNQGNFSVRAANVAQYWSPNFAGFGFKLAYVPDEARTATVTPTMTGASLTWSKGPVYLVYAYEEHKNYTGGNAQRLQGRGQRLRWRLHHGQLQVHRPLRRVQGSRQHGRGRTEAQGEVLLPRRPVHDGQARLPPDLAAG